MLERSVPFYSEIQRMTGELVADFAADGTSVYDLGLLDLHHVPGDGARSSRADRERSLRGRRLLGRDAQDRGGGSSRRRDSAGRSSCVHADLDQGVAIENASVVLLVLTLQFVRPLYRERLIRIDAATGSPTTAASSWWRRCSGENSTFNRLFINHYYEMKRRNGYSDLEIAQKREALENVLIPYRLEENKDLLRKCGFEHVDVFFKWYNFCAMIATK